MNINLFENELFSVKPTLTDKLSIMFVDFQYNALKPPPLIGPNIYTKTTSLNQFIFPYKPTPEIVANEIKKQFIKKVSDLGQFKREQNIDFVKKFDINIPDMKRRGIDITRGINAKILNLSNYIAIEGRIGPAQWMLVNSKTYQFLLKYFGQMNFLFDNGNLVIGNIRCFVNNNVEDDVILFGRKNSPEQPGVHCFILVDENNDIVFDTLVDPNFETKYVMYFDIIDVGFYPYYQFHKMNTRSISYYRNLKLQKIQNLYNTRRSISYYRNLKLQKIKELYNY
jgi:hypothetical protein